MNTGTTTTLPIVAPCAACIHDRVCAIKGSIGMSKVTLTVSILAPEVTPRAMPDQIVVDCSEFLDARVVAARVIDAVLAPEPAPEPIVAAPPEPEPPAKPVEAHAPPVSKPGKAGRPVRALEEVMVPCDPGCGLFISASAVGAHRRECEAVKALKANHVTVVDQGEWPRPLPDSPTDLAAARVEFEGKRAAASRSASAATWDRNHPDEIPRPSHVPAEPKSKLADIPIQRGPVPGNGLSPQQARIVEAIRAHNYNIHAAGDELGARDLAFRMAGAIRRGAVPADVVKALV